VLSTEDLEHLFINYSACSAVRVFSGGNSLSLLQLMSFSDCCAVKESRGGRISISYIPCSSRLCSRLRGDETDSTLRSKESIRQRD
jgi:hypothetical protein